MTRREGAKGSVGILGAGLLAVGVPATGAAAPLTERPYGNALGDNLEGLQGPVDPVEIEVCAGAETLRGIDVSYYQGDIDWNAVAADGISFAWVRVSHSTQFFDPQFDANLAGARAAGIHTGVYQYFEPTEDPIAQADFLLDHMGPLQPGDMPPMIDVESADTVAPAVAMADYTRWLRALPGKPVFELLVVGPVIVPNIAIAIATYLVFDGLKLTGTTVGFVAAHTALAMPFVVFTILASLYRFDADLERAALSCGASPLQAFTWVTFPQILPGIVSAALFAFIISFDEPVISFFISNLDHRSLPRKMFEDIDYNVSPTLAAVATVLTGLTVLALVLGHFAGRGNRRGASVTRDR